MDMFDFRLGCDILLKLLKLDQKHFHIFIFKPNFKPSGHRTNGYLELTIEEDLV